MAVALLALALAIRAEVAAVADAVADVVASVAYLVVLPYVVVTVLPFRAAKFVDFESYCDGLQVQGCSWTGWRAPATETVSSSWGKRFEDVKETLEMENIDSVSMGTEGIINVLVITCTWQCR